MLEKTSQNSIAIIGSGLLGLATAYLALKKGYKVTIYSKDKYDKTVSVLAGASFKLNKVGPIKNIKKMIQDTWNEYELLKDVSGILPVSGVRLAIHMVASNKPISEENMQHLISVKNIKRYPKDDPYFVIPGGYKYAISYTTFRINPHLFLGYLFNKINLLGGKFVKRFFGSENEFASLPQQIIINCTGLGARKLSQDNWLKPIKGQLVMVIYPKNKLKESLGTIESISAGHWYIYPHLEEINKKEQVEVILGGTALESDSIIPDPKITQEILAGNGKILAGLVEKKSLAGFRPYREGGPRVGKRILKDKIIIDNYGHGGSGYTLCFGSAKRALGYVKKV